MKEKITKFFNNLKNNKKLIMIVVLILFVVIPLMYTFAKYINQKITEHYLSSKGFYFDSEVLNNKTYDLYGWDGISNYVLNVDIKNAKDQLNWTKENINYNVTSECTSSIGNVNCSVSGATSLAYNQNSYTSNINKITIEKGNLTFNKGDIVTVVIKAISTTPYKKELTATFKIHVNDIGLNYYINDSENSNYLELVIANNSEDKDITIDYDESLINIDSTNYFIKNGTQNVKTENNITFIDTVDLTLEHDKVYTIRFYKNDITKNYKLDQDIIDITE